MEVEEGTHDEWRRETDGEMAKASDVTTIFETETTWREPVDQSVGSDYAS